MVKLYRISIYAANSILLLNSLVENKRCRLDSQFAISNGLQAGYTSCVMALKLYMILHFIRDERSNGDRYVYSSCAMVGRCYKLRDGR